VSQYKTYVIPAMNTPADLPKAIREFAASITNIYTGKLYSDYQMTPDDVDAVFIVESGATVHITTPPAGPGAFPVGGYFGVYVKEGYAKIVPGAGQAVQKVNIQEVRAGELVYVYCLDTTTFYVNRDTDEAEIPDGVSFATGLHFLADGRLHWSVFHGSLGAPTGYEIRDRNGNPTTLPVAIDRANRIGTINAASSQPQTDYTFKVRSIHGSIYGPWSNVVSTQYNAPSNPILVDANSLHTGNGQFTVRTADPADASKFTVTATVLGGGGNASVAAGNGGQIITCSGSTTQTIKLEAYAGSLKFWEHIVQRQPHTHRSENHRYPCGSHQCNCSSSWAACGCGGCDRYPAPNSQSWGQCGCGPAWGIPDGTMCWYGGLITTCGSCTSYCDNWVSVLNDVAGWQNRHGEWYTG